MVTLPTHRIRVRPNDSEILVLLKRQKQALMRRDATVAMDLWRSWTGVQRIIAVEAERVAHDILERSRRGMAVAEWRIKRLETYQLLEATAKREAEVFLNLARGRITDLGSEFAVAGRIDAGAVLSEITGRPIIDVIGSFTMLPREAITTMLATTGPGSPLDRLLHAIPIADAWEGVPRKLLTGLALGKNPRVIGRQIASEFHLPLSRSLAIARTESMRAYRLASLGFYQSSGIVKGCKRLSARDERVCAACLASDGEFYSLNDEFAEHVNGRCTLVPVLDGYEPQFETGSEWFAKQPEAVQRRILGPTRFQFYRDGMPLSEMWERVPNKVWGPANVMKPLDKLRSFASTVRAEPSSELPEFVGRVNHAGIATKEQEAYEEYVKRAKARGVTPLTMEEVKARMAEELLDSRNRFAIRAERHTVFEILSDGRFKTQFEVNRSGGTYNPRIRAKVEREGFGIPDSIDPRERPIYGYLTRADNATLEDGIRVSNYGDTRIILKRDRILNRTTFTTFDSLFMVNGEYGYPSPLVDPSPTSAGYAFQLDKLVEEGFDGLLPCTTYLEIQVHGGVTLEDIEIIEFRGPILPGEKQELERRGIKWIEIE